MDNYVSKYTGAQIDEAVGKALNGGADGEDGFSPVANVQQTADGAVITITDKDGTTTATVTNGADGEDGVSPTVSVSKSGKVTTLTIADATDTKTATINDGADGDDGVGIKSVAQTTTTTEDGGSNVVTVTLTDNTTATFTVKNGSKGQKGDDATVTADSIRDALGYTPANVSDVFENALQPTFTNVFDTVEIEYGKIIGVTDMTVGDTSANLATTGYIPVKSGSVIRVNEDFPITNSGSSAYILYDASKTALYAFMSSAIVSNGYYVSSVATDANGYLTEIKVNKPSSVAYIRICVDSRCIGKNPILTVDEEIEYEVGYGTKLNPKIRVEQSQILNAPQKNGWSILPGEHLNIAYSFINRKPVNTVAHFTDAAENFGYNALKCDVRPTSDGELVCCHDAGFTFDGNGYITTYDASNSTAIHDVTAATCLGYSHRTGDHPCLVGDYLDVCRKYGKVAFITIRNEYMDVVIPKLLEELRIHNMTYSSIINCMTYESLVSWRQQDKAVMINYTLNFGVAIDQMQIDRAIGLGYCSLCGFSLSGSSTDPSAACDFEYARANGIRLLEAIAYKEGSPEACYAMGYDGCQIAYPWGTPSGGGMSESSVQSMIDGAIGTAIGGAY